jgi:hypothetical protein
MSMMHYLILRSDLLIQIFRFNFDNNWRYVVNPVLVNAMGGNLRDGV